MFKRLAAAVVAHRIPVLVFVALLTAGSAWLAPNVGFDFTPQQLFEQQNDINEFAEGIREDFGDETNTLIVLWRGDDVFEPGPLTDLATMTRELEEWEPAVRVVSLANMRLPRNELVEPNDGGEPERVLDLGPLIGDPPVDEARAERVRELVEGEPLLERTFVSEDGSHAAILIELTEDARDINTLFEVVDELRERVDGWESSLPSEPDLEVSGLPAVRVDIIRSLQQEQLRFMPLVVVFMLILLAWLFRRASGIVLPLVSVLLAVLWTVAGMVLLEQPINIINSVLPTLLMIIGLSDAIHLLSRAAEENESGRDRNEIVRATVRRMGLACLLTSTTTAIGFGSLIMSRTEILRDFGLHAAMGVMLAYVATILFIPPMLTWMRPPTRKGMHVDATPDSDAPKSGIIERAMLWTGTFVVRRPVQMLVLGAVVTTLAALSIWQWGRIDTRLLEVFPEDNPTAQLTREVNDELAGVLPLIVSVEAKEPGYFEDPEHLAALAELQGIIEASDPELVLKTASVNDMLQVFRAAYLDDPSVRGTPFESEAQVKAVLRLYRRDAAEDVNRTLGPENRHAIISVRLDDLGIQRGQRAIDAVADHADRLFGEGAGDGIREARAPENDSDVQVRLAGDVYLASVGLNNFIWDLLGSLGLATILIFGVMTLLFRSLRLGLISVVPNALPLVLTFGYMSARGIELNTSTVVIFSISLGLAVDDTIHFLTRYEEERSAGHGLRAALRRTFLGAGRAIIITSVVLLGGLLILLSTDFNPTRYFAELTACTVFGAILGDLFVLPAMLVLFDREADGESRLAMGDGATEGG